MKKTYLVLSIVLFGLTTAYLYASSDFDLSQLNPALVPLFEAIESDLDAPDQLIDRTMTIDVTIRLATMNHLLFEDGYVVVSPDTKYAFLKFERGMELPHAFEQGDQVSVEFEILSVEQGAVAGNMPHLIVRLLSIRRQAAV